MFLMQAFPTKPHSKSRAAGISTLTFLAGVHSPKAAPEGAFEGAQLSHAYMHLFSHIHLFIHTYKISDKEVIVQLLLVKGFQTPNC